MKTSWTTWLAISLWTLTLVVVVCVLTLMYASNRLAGLWLEGIGINTFAVCTLACVGALLAAHRPGNPIGWIFLIAALSGAINGASDEYSYYIVEIAPDDQPVLTLLFWLGEWLWVFTFFLPPTFGILLFPTGKLPSQRWRPFAWLIAVCLTFFIVTQMFSPGPYDSTDEKSKFTNPVGIQTLGGTFESLILTFTVIVWPFLFIGSVLSIFIRMRQATDRERQQIKWFAFAATIPLIGFFIDIALYNFTDAGIGILVVFLGIAILPIAIGIAILRHNLYDIDRIINRSLVYGSLSVLLLFSFTGSVILFQFLLDPITGGNDLAVAGSTLLVAALFRPVRNRVQHIVDRRFYRRKYHAQQTLQSFGVTARNAVKLDQLSGELTNVVVATMQPEHVSIWLPNDTERIVRQ